MLTAKERAALMLAEWAAMPVRDMPEFFEQHLQAHNHMCRDVLAEVKRLREQVALLREPGYEVLTDYIRCAPRTWLGGLLRAAVESSIDQGFFRSNESLAAYVAEVVAERKDGE